MKKRILPLIIALCAVMAFSGAVYAAANRVALGTSAPNIPKSLCYQAGSISMEFSADTVLRSGDVIQYTLNNGVVICKDIDFYLRLHEGLGRWFVPGTDTANPVSATVDEDLIQLDGFDDPEAPAVPTFLTGYDYGFRVKALAGSQIIQLTVGSRNTATGEFNEGGNDSFALLMYMEGAGADPLDVVFVFIFDEKSTAAYLWKDDDAVAGTFYTNDSTNLLDPFTFADNTICIDTTTFDYQGERVEVTPDSLPILPDNKLTFTGEREIARILAADEYVLVTCKNAPVVRNIEIGGSHDANYN